MVRSDAWLTVLGWAGWITFGFLKLPWPPTRLEWVPFILLWGILILIPFSIRRSENSLLPNLLLPIAGLFVLASFLSENTLASGLLFLPWLACSLGLLLQSVQKGPSAYGILSALFLVIGAAWGTAYGFGWSPMGFDPLIVLLTAVHFHFAGFLLTSLAGRLVELNADKIDPVLWIGLIGGVPLVATGITVSHLNGPAWIEAVAVIWMATTVFMVVWKYNLLIRRKGLSFLNYLGIILLGTDMVLAVLYGIRSYFPMPQLSIPWMYALHGTANALGLSLLWSGLRSLPRNKG